MKNRSLRESRPFRFCGLMVHRYLKHNVAAQSAALAFYLLFMLFPFLIFVSALLGLLRLDVAGVLTALREFLPTEVLDLVEMYLTHVTRNPSLRLMVFGLVFSLFFPMRAANALMNAVRTAYHLGPSVGLRQWIKVLIYTVTLLAAVILTLALMTFGQRALRYAVVRFDLPEFAAVLWVRLRFPVAAAAGFFALFMLYELAQDTPQPLRNIWPGTLFSLAAWMALSWLYAWYADHLSHYSLLYGSLGAVIVVLIWLELTAATLIMGAEMNGVLISMRRERQSSDAAG